MAPGEGRRAKHGTVRRGESTVAQAGCKLLHTSEPERAARTREPYFLWGRPLLASRTRGEQAHACLGRLARVPRLPERMSETLPTDGHDATQIHSVYRPRNPRETPAKRV